MPHGAALNSRHYARSTKYGGLRTEGRRIFYFLFCPKGEALVAQH
nr:MAG TPA: hypothetical protein [Caudoviricetes sp.]